jgi:hypothetical protein
MEKKCSICIYGDGKWKEREGQKVSDKLPICELCRKDGWGEATLDDVEQLNLDIRRKQIYDQQKERNR